jgi:uncharacterized protein YegL
MDAMPQRAIYQDPNLVLNPERRLACVILADVSASMAGNPIDQLNRGLQAFHRDLSSDPVALKRVEVALVTFGPVKVALDFTTADNARFPHLDTEDDTPLGEATERALAMVEARKRAYNANGISYYRPQIYGFSDGFPTDDYKRAAKAVAAAEHAKKAAFFSIGVDGADMGVLKQLSVRPPLKLDGLDFTGLFLWLSASLRSRSKSAVNSSFTSPPLPRTVTVSQ